MTVSVAGAFTSPRSTAELAAVNAVENTSGSIVPTLAHEVRSVSTGDVAGTVARGMDGASSAVIAPESAQPCAAGLIATRHTNTRIAIIQLSFMFCGLRASEESRPRPFIVRCMAGVFNLNNPGVVRD